MIVLSPVVSFLGVVQVMVMFFYHTSHPNPLSGFGQTGANRNIVAFEVHS